MRLYDHMDSGNGYKVRLLLHRQAIPFELVEVAIFEGESRRPEFLAKNPIGKIPLLELDNGERLAESNAILCYLAEGTPLLPASGLARARVMEWLFFEQYSHEPNIATIRSWLRHNLLDDLRRAMLPSRREAGLWALGVMEGRLAGHDWLAGEQFSIADIALYAYTHVADQAEFDLSPFPGIVAWLKRVAAQPGHVPIDWRP